MTAPLDPAVRAYMAEQGRKSAQNRDMREIGRRGGQVGGKVASSNMSPEQRRARASKAGQASAEKRWGKGLAVAAPVEAPPADTFAEFELVNGPWVSEAEARRAWEQVILDKSVG